MTRLTKLAVEHGKEAEQARKSGLLIVAQK